MSASQVNVDSYVEIHGQEPVGQKFWSFDLVSQSGFNHIYTYNMEFTQAVRFAKVMGKILEVRSIKLRH